MIGRDGVLEELDARADRGEEDLLQIIDKAISSYEVLLDFIAQLKDVPKHTATSVLQEQVGYVESEQESEGVESPPANGIACVGEWMSQMSINDAIEGP